MNAIENNRIEKIQVKVAIHEAILFVLLIYIYFHFCEFYWHVFVLL